MKIANAQKVFYRRSHAGIQYTQHNTHTSSKEVSFQNNSKFIPLLLLAKVITMMLLRHADVVHHDSATSQIFPRNDSCIAEELVVAHILHGTPHQIQDGQIACHM